jgi:transcriptional regulator of acetoin/glycerol metabolism
MGEAVVGSWQESRAGSPGASRLLIERAHEELIAGNLDDQRLLQVRPLVRESWVRSWRGRVGPEGTPRIEFERDELEAYRRAHPLASAMEMIRTLLLPGETDDSGVVIAVGDHAGRLLWIEGDHQLQSLTEGMGFVAGANWAEDAVGTTAPGTALTLGQSVQIRGAEHYNRLVHPWSCTAAPEETTPSRRRRACSSTRPRAQWNRN